MARVRQLAQEALAGLRDGLMRKILVTALLAGLYFLVLTPAAFFARAVSKRHYLRDGEPERPETAWRPVSISSHDVPGYRRLF